jgi:toxin ParE1/3/4
MLRLVTSPRAKRDIVEILRYTRERWGRRQAQQYRELIRQAFHTIAQNPDCGPPRFDVVLGVRGYHIRQPGKRARHVVFYRIGPSGLVEIVRVLHDSMDFDRHLR